MISKIKSLRAKRSNPARLSNGLPRRYAPRNDVFVILILLCATFMCFITYNVQAQQQQQQQPNISPELRKYISQIMDVEKYLSSFNSIQATFAQIIPGVNAQSRGLFYIKRPGKARWEYHKPVRTLLVIKDGRLSFYDYDLDQVTFSDVPRSPLEILLNSDVRLLNNPELRVVDVQEDKTTLTITVKPTGAHNKKATSVDFLFDANSTNEALTMVFSKNPLTLKRLKRTDENNTSTLLELSQVKFNADIDDELFVFQNPKLFKKRKN